MTKTARGFLDYLDGLEDVLFAFFAEAGKVAQLGFTRELFHVLDRGRFEGAPEECDFFGAQRLNVEQVENSGRIFLKQLLAEAVIAGL